VATYDQTAPVNADVPPTPSERSKWQDTIARWDSAVSNFLHNDRLLRSKAAIANASPELRKQYEATLSTNQMVKKRIDELNAAIADVQDWLAGAWDKMRNVWAYVSGQVSSLFGYSAPRMRSVSLGELGQAQIIPLAIVAAGIAWVASKALDSYNLNQKLDSVKGYVDKGYTPQDAAAIVQKTADSGGMFSGLSSTVKWGALGVFALAAGYLVWEHYQKSSGGH